MTVIDNDAPPSQTQNSTTLLLPTDQAASPIAPGPVALYATNGGSDLQLIQQAEPDNFQDVDPNVIDVGPRQTENFNPPAIQQQPVPTVMDMSDPYFGGSTISTLTDDPAASEQPFDLALAQSDAEAQRLAGFAGGPLYRPGSSVSPVTGTVTGGSDDGGNATSLAYLYSNVGEYSTGTGQDPSDAGDNVSGTALLQSQTEALPAGPLTRGLQLTTGPNNTAQATDVDQVNPLVLLAVGAFILVTLLKDKA